MSVEFRVLTLSEMPTVLTWEMNKLAVEIKDEMERHFAAWKAKWRGEALEHYIPKGWSVGAWDGNELAGYFLGQPLLFFSGDTQTLWIEHIGAQNSEVQRQLIDIACKYARDKHLQRVLFCEIPGFPKDFPNAHAFAPSVYQVATTKSVK